MHELVSDGLIQGKEFADWRALGEHRVPTPGLGEIILFVSFIRAGLRLPTSAFLHRFLGYFGISLNHLAPNDVLHLSVFVHLCETFLGIPPSLSLFRYFFCLKPQPAAMTPMFLVAAGFSFVRVVRVNSLIMTWLIL